MGINMIQKNIGASKITVIDWCKRYLNDQFGEKHSENVYEAVWGNKFAVKNKYTYDAIKNYMEKQNGYLLSTREEWRRLKELPSERYIRVGHILKKKHHIWFVKVRYLMNQGRWCPECNNYVCERVLKLYMNKLFEVKFRPITLNRAFGLKKEDGGLLKYDAFNKNVKIGNFKFSIAAEYDGEQHDIFPNYYHKSVEDYYVQKRRDRLKDELSIENNTILIRIKASEGFNRNTINCFQEEIIRQVNLNSIIKKSNVKLLSIPKYTYNPHIKKLESNKESLEYFI